MESKSIQLGMEYEIKLHTPLMFMTKAETVKLAQENTARKKEKALYEELKLKYEK